ncbi:hypothetical protein F4780DRAFT_790810 [Xylariomycetidae sp. FL0641]|nr:hypothetical protein F4780DRAFT_790810 [Xylariomycetidae sp. FL0641]
MVSGSRRDSWLRCGTLGGRSECYSHVANWQPTPGAGYVEVDDPSHSDNESISSHGSTVANVDNKPPPPGYPSRSSQSCHVGSAARPSTASSGPGPQTRSQTVDNYIGQRIEQGQSNDDDDDDDDDACSNYSNATYSYTPRPAHPTAKRGVQSSRVNQLTDVHTWSSYTPEDRPPPVPPKDWLAKRDPESRAEKIPVNRPQSQQFAYPERNTDTQFRGRPQSAYIEEKIPTVPTPSRGRATVVASPVSYTRTPSSSPSPSRSRSPSPAPVWRGDRPRQREASFIDRAKNRVERKYHEELVKAGRRPPPKFRVRGVRAPPDVANAYVLARQPGVAELPVPVPAVQPQPQPVQSSQSPNTTNRLSYAHRWRDMLDHQAMEVGRSSRRAHEEVGSRPPPPAVVAVAELSAGADVAVPAFLNQAATKPSREELFAAAASTPAPGLFDPTWVRPELARRRSSPELPRLASRELLPPARNDSLFLGRGARDAGASFFAPQWSQVQVRAQMDRAAEEVRGAAGKSRHDEDRGETQRPLGREQLELAALPSALGFDAPRWSQGRDGEAKSCDEDRRDAPHPLGREQLEFAALPSALDFDAPLDQRRCLPRQAPVAMPDPRDYAPPPPNALGGRGLSRKMGMRLR